jgi:hypothetical protein
MIQPRASAGMTWRHPEIGSFPSIMITAATRIAALYQPGTGTIWILKRCEKRQNRVTAED